MSDLGLVFLEFKHLQDTKKSVFFLSVNFYLFIIIQCINVLHVFVHIHCVQTHRMSSFFFACCLTNALCNNTLHLLYFDEFIKKEPLNGLFMLSIFLTLNLPQLKLEFLNCQKSDIRTNSPSCSVLLWTSFCFPKGNQQKRLNSFC